ncbi:hypothetical protein AB7008_19580 [Bradyrhizobium sp. 521_C7_N1_3]|uniref:hypothetical protein n=1 Tax=Bradyrhizobium TaxID=374 RepID=UPI0027149D38|nr:hypothetical protein [Bradyrhizobium japonicum]WLB51230.1 hypothetical protein QIH94_28170 [Bradyrhizobium japonicum]WLB67848.1 hypothetical protein QIH96_18155 [Bradyrhizobium japonicum]
MSPSLYTRIGLAGAVAVVLALAGIAAAQTIAKTKLSTASSMNLPDYLVPVTDPDTGATIVRITTPGPLGNGLACQRAYCTHRYSSAQAWNADQTLLLIANGCNGLCFLDGRTYVPLFRRQREDECEWHPRDPERMICVIGRKISLWTPRTNAEEIMLMAEGYRGLQFGPGKGNPSQDGRRIAVRGTRADGVVVAFAFDLVSRQKFPDIEVGKLPGRDGSCEISALGSYVSCSRWVDGKAEAFIYTVAGDLVQSWTEHHRPSHGDMAVDADGREIYVGISKSDPDVYQVIKRRLDDGVVTALAPRGEASHASTRAIHWPGWVILSYGGDPAEIAQLPKFAPFAREVIALRIDGSGEFRRIAYTRNVPHDYWSETHGSPSPDGSQVIWSSNWGVAGGPVFDFVTRLDAPDRTSALSR